jgi:hypothetical protein
MARASLSPMILTLLRGEDNEKGKEKVQVDPRHREAEMKRKIFTSYQGALPRQRLQLKRARLLREPPDFTHRYMILMSSQLWEKPSEVACAWPVRDIRLQPVAC